jgi:hypothetical protein
MTSHSVGETSGLGARLEKNKRHAMYGVDDTELQELLKQEREKVETSSHTVAKDLGPRQPPTGGQGGASISRGGL